MNKIAIVVLAGTETHEALGRVVNALELAKELQEHNDDVQIIFDGADSRIGRRKSRCPSALRLSKRFHLWRVSILCKSIWRIQGRKKIRNKSA